MVRSTIIIKKNWIKIMYMLIDLDQHISDIGSRSWTYERFGATQERHRITKRIRKPRGTLAAEIHTKQRHESEQREHLVTHTPYNVIQWISHTRTKYINTQYLPYIFKFMLISTNRTPTRIYFDIQNFFITSTLVRCMSICLCLDFSFHLTTD